MTRRPTPPAGPTNSAVPRVERQLDPTVVLFVAEDETRFRVMDCIMVNGQLRRLRLESPRATCRIFLGRRGEMLHYGRKPRETWTISPEALQRQLRAAVPSRTEFAKDEPDLLP